MLQAAWAGHVLSNSSNIINNPTYYEPGFNLMSPLEIEGEKVDVFYILLRKRANNEGTEFSKIDINNLEISVTDASNGEILEFNISYPDEINSNWADNPSYFYPALLTINSEINIDLPVLKILVINVSVKDTSDNSFIVFRVVLSDENKPFHYIIVERDKIEDRNVFSSESREAYIKINSNSDYYMLFSPYSYILETNKNESDFSYPQNSIFYKKQKTFNNENYSFSINSYSHSFVPEVFSLMNIPGYQKVGIIIIDSMMYYYLSALRGQAFVEISIEGMLSGIKDIFKIYFER